MKNITRTISFVMTSVFISAAPATIRAASSGDDAVHAHSALAQLQRANALWDKIHRATSEHERRDVVRATWECLAAIPAAWPDDANAVVQSGILRYELASEVGMTQSGIDALLEVEPLAPRTPLATDVERRLGEAYVLQGDTRAAEIHFRTAERDLRADANAVEAGALLLSAGGFYAQQHNIAEAIRLFDRGAEWPGAWIASRIQFRLAAARAAVRLEDESRRDIAVRELGALDELIIAGRSNPVTSADGIAAESAAREASRIRQELDVVPFDR